MPAYLENSAVATGLEKVSFHSNPKERQCQRMLKHCTIAFISHASKVVLKILQARLQKHMNCELPDVQAGFRKGRATRDHGIRSHHFMANKWGNNGNSDRLYFGGLQKSLQMVTEAMKLKDACSFKEKLR